MTKSPLGHILSPMNRGQTDLPSTAELKALPKVELHRHLEGSVRLSTLIELAPQVGIELPARQQDIEEYFLVKSPMKDLASVLNKFWMTQSVLNSSEIIERISFEAVEDAHLEGIRLLELRYSPSFIQTNHEYLKFEHIHAAVEKGVQKASSHFQMGVGLIGTLQRILPLNVCDRVCDFILEHKESFIGIDLADDEMARPPKDFQKIFEKALNAGLPVTIHAGESKFPNSTQHVLDAIEYLGARRIGHGVQIANDLEVQKQVIARKIPLEICPISNWLTNAVSDLEAHPIRQLIQNGVLVTINSDDPGIFGTSLMADYELLASRYEFQISDFERANDIAAQASFIPLAKKQRFWPRPIHKI